MVNGIPLNGYATEMSMDMQASPTAVANNGNLINLGKQNYFNMYIYHLFQFVTKIMFVF